MSGDDKSQKTEAPSKRKLERAREQGQVARSQDLPSAAALTGAVVLLMIFMPKLGISFTEFFIQNAKDFPIGELSQSGFITILNHYLIIFALHCFPILILIWLITFLSTAAQVGLKLSLKAIEPKLEKLNPVEGFKRLFSTKSLIKTGLSVLKMAAISFIAFSVVMARNEEFVIMNYQDQATMLSVIGSIAYEIGLKSSGALLILALVDYFYQKWQFMEDQKMSLKDLKDEHKQQEGDPHIKSKIRQKQKAAASKRGLKESVATADVVIVNPYHIAVAVKYDRLSPDSAPFVVAKGARLLAQRIKDFAKESEIDIIQNIPLARGLYKDCRVDMEVPPEFYVAVAEVLAVVYQKRDRQHFHG